MWCCSCFSTVGAGRKSERSSGGTCLWLKLPCVLRKLYLQYRIGNPLHVGTRWWCLNVLKIDDVYYTRWWFQTFLFSPWGFMIQFDDCTYFSNKLKLNHQLVKRCFYGRQFPALTQRNISTEPQPLRTGVDSRDCRWNLCGKLQDPCMT